jgi:signal transduction histidine kinase
VFKAFNIKEAVEKVICIQRKQAQDKGLQLFATYVNIGEQAGMHSPVIFSDEQRLKQVLLNLQSNALKFTQRGKVEIKLTITEEHFLKVQVIDSGVGIR